MPNMDGDSFEQWRFKVDRAINRLALEAYMDLKTPSGVAMYNCNYDAKAAAKEWLRKRLDRAG